MAITIQSNNIRVFPTTQRENADPSAKFTTEYNLTSLLNKLLDRKAFVITSDEDLKKGYKVAEGKIDSLEFNIMGYFFTISNLELTQIITASSPISGYIDAAIEIKKQDYVEISTGQHEFKNWWQLKGTDEDNNYSGLSFQTAPLDEVSKRPIPTFTPMAEYSGVNADYGIIVPDDIGSAQTGYTATYRFTILQYSKIGDTNFYNISIPKDSRIKFQTNKDGSQHSLAIDDGELVPQEPVQQTFNLRRPSAPIIEETFDGLSLNVSKLSLFEGELFRLEVEYDNIGDIIFTSSDNNIATVSSNGLVRGVNKGNCLIVASYNDMNAVCSVNVI